MIIKITWPEAVAPFRVGLINLQTKVAECVNAADKVYKTLKSDGILYDDTKECIGAKFAKMDLMANNCWKKVVSENIVEVKNRATGEVEQIQIEEAVNCFSTK